MTRFIQFWKNTPVVQEIALVFRYIDPIERYPMRNNGRHHHGLLYALEGRETYRTQNATLHTEPGDVFYLPKSERYGVEMSDPCCTVLCIDFETGIPVDSTAFQLRPVNSRLFKGYFVEMEHIWQLKRVGWEMECLSMLYHIMAEMQRQAQARYFPSDMLGKIQPGVDYLHKHFDNPNLRVEELAQKSGFHPRYFAKVFRDAYGVSPKQYLTQLRMERARELILSNRYTVSQIAQMTGYGEIYHFSKAFKQENGVTPTEYNRKWEGN